MILIIVLLSPYSYSLSIYIRFNRFNSWPVVYSLSNLLFFWDFYKAVYFDENQESYVLISYKLY